MLHGMRTGVGAKIEGVSFVSGAAINGDRSHFNLICHPIPFRPQVQDTLGITVIVYLISVLLTVCFEVPVTRVIRLFVK